MTSTAGAADPDVVEDRPSVDEVLALAVTPHDGGNMVALDDLPLNDSGVLFEAAERPKCLHRLACR